MTARRGALVLVATLVLLAWPSQALAHANLVGSDPADGSRLSSAPRQIRLSFDEEVSETLSKGTLTGARTGVVPGVEFGSAPGRSLVVTLPHLRKDTYVFTWQTVSKDDLHVTGGSLAFSVGGAAVPVGGKGAANTSTSDEPSGAEVVLRWIDFVAIAGLIGALALTFVCLPAGSHAGSDLDPVERRLVVLAVAAGVLALDTGIALLVVQADAVQGAGSSIGTVLAGTSYGTSWIVRELLLVILVAGALLVRGSRRRQLLAAVIGVAAASLCGALALNSHASAAQGHVSFATAALALHTLAAAFWVGGVGALALVLYWTRNEGPFARTNALLLRRFSGLALLSVCTLAVTGIYVAGIEVASPDALLTTFYGWTLMAKIGLFLALGLVGLSNSLVVHDVVPRQGLLRRGVRVEAVLLVGVLLFAAVLMSSSPARGPRFAAVAAASGSPDQTRVSASTGDLLVSLSVKPNQPGTNFVTANVFDTRRPAPAVVRSVEVSMGLRAGSSWLPAKKVRSHTWQVVGGQLTRPGPVVFGIRIRRDGLPNQVAKLGWTVAPRRVATPARPVVVSQRPLAPILTPAALAGTGAILLAVLGLVTRRLLRRGFRDVVGVH